MGSDVHSGAPDKTAANSEPPFVDQRRINLTTQLASRVPRLGQEPLDGPRVVVIQGEPGSGKSRIIRELYETLASSRPEGGPRYWPPLPPVTREASGVDRWRGRKVLGPIDLHDPSFRAPGALPHFAWLHSRVTAIEGSGLTTVSGDLRAQLNAHRDLINLAVKGDHATAKTVLSLGLEAVLRVAVRVFGSSLNGSIAGLPLDEVLLAGADEAVVFGEGVRDAVSQHQRVQRGGAASEGPRAALAAVSELTEVGQPRMPTVLVLEDIHLMDVDVRDFLVLLTALQDDDELAKWPLLVVGTAQDSAAPGPVFPQWLDRRDRSRVELIELQDLDDEAVTVIVRHFARNTPVESPVVRDLIAHTRNPLALMAMLSDSKFLTIDGGVVQAPRRWDLVPRDLKGVFNAYWDGLPSDTQDALLSAVLALPDKALDSPDVWPFLIDVVQLASPPAEDGTISEFGATAFTHAEAIGWLRVLPDLDGLDVLNNWLMAQVISGKVDPMDRDSRDQFQERICEQLTRLLMGFLLDPANTDEFDQLCQPRPQEVAAARWLYSLRAGRLAGPRGDIANSVHAWAGFIVASADANVGSYLSALRTFVPGDPVEAVRKVDVLRYRLCDMRLQVADWYDRAGSPERAASLSRQVSFDIRDFTPPDSPHHPYAIKAEAAWITYAGRHAELMKNSGQLERAIEMLGDVLTDASNSDASYFGGLFVTRMALRGALADIERETDKAGSRALLQAAETDYIAWQAQQSRHVPQTSAEARQALNEVAEVARHHERFAAHIEDPGTSAALQRVVEAVSLLEDVVLRQRALLTPAEDGLRTRNELIRIRREAEGDPGAELIAMHALDKDASEELPIDNLTRLTIRRNYIDVLGGTRHDASLGKAQKLCVQLVSDYQAFHPTHPDRLDAEELLASLNMLTGR